MVRAMVAAIAAALLPGYSATNPFAAGAVREVCHIPGDEDGNGRADCADPDCALAPACRDDVWGWCEDGLDNDGDGLTDCADDPCRRLPPCHQRCEGGRDEDGDGAIDCHDADCEGHTACAEDCGDGVDNADADGLADCADPECAGRPPCIESCDVAGDEDSDGDADCADAECARDLGCLAARPLRRDAPCAPTRPGPTVTDGFDAGVDAETWSAFSTSACDAPAPSPAPGAVDLGGRDGVATAGLASRARFGTGAAQPFSLSVRLRPEGVCGELDDSACSVRIELHTRDVWDDADQVSGVSILAVDVQARSRWHPAQGRVVGTKARVACEFHGAPTIASVPDLPYTEGSLIEVALSTAGRVVTVHVLGAQVCELGPIPDLEPEARLVPHAGGRPVEAPAGAAEGRLLLDAVDLDVAQQAPPPACRGLRRSLFPGGLEFPRGVGEDAHTMSLPYDFAIDTFEAPVHAYHRCLQAGAGAARSRRAGTTPPRRPATPCRSDASPGARPGTIAGGSASACPPTRSPCTSCAGRTGASSHGGRAARARRRTAESSTSARRPAATTRPRPIRSRRSPRRARAPTAS